MEDDDGQKSPSRHAHWRLVDRDGGFFVLPESVTLVGREGCHIASSSRSVDLKHAIISFDYCTSCFKIKDLSSLNGTYVNDTRIPEQTYINLNHGDHLRLGYDATVYRVELVACSPQGFVQYLAADVLAAAETAGGRSPSGSVDSRWVQAFSQPVKQADCCGGSRMPLLPVAECQGCIKEQLLHHTCDDNAEDARQAGLNCDGSRIHVGGSRSGITSSPSGERVAHIRSSPVLAAVTVVNRPTWDRKDSPDYAAASALPWLLPADFSSGAWASDQGSVLRKSYSLPEAATPASPSAAASAAVAGSQPVAARGTPLYGQPEWWGERGDVGEALPVADGTHARSQRQTQWQHRAADAAGNCVGRSERAPLSAMKPSTATRPVSLQTEQMVARAVGSAGSEMTSVATCQPNASTVSPGKSLEPLMPSTAFTVNFDNASDLSQGEDALSPKMGDSLSRFMPEQLRQSLRKRLKKANKEPTAADEPLTAGTSGGPSDAVSSLTHASVKSKKDGAHKVTAPIADDISGDVSANSAAAAMACTSEKILKVRVVPSSVAFLMRKMYGNGSEDAAGGNDFGGDDSDGAAEDKRVFDGARDDAVSEAGTYTVDISDAARRGILADGQCSDNDLSSLDSGGDVGDAQPRPSSPQLLDEDFTSNGRGQSPVSAREHISSASPVMCAAVGQQSTFDTGLPIRGDFFHSSFDVEVGHWHAESISNETSSGDVLQLQTVTLSKPGGKNLCSSPVTTPGVLLDRGAVGAAAPNASGSKRSLLRPGNEAPSSIAVDRQSPIRIEQELAEDALSPSVAAATAAMFAGMVDARSSIISPVEHDAELLLSAAAAAASARADDSPAAAARRARREAAGGELSKARLLQELGIGDEPVQPVAERPKLVQELLSSRKHHREDDPVIVSSSKNFFEKIRPKSDSEPGNRVSVLYGKPPPHHPAHVERTGVSSVESDVGVYDGAGDAAAASRTSLAGGQGDHWAANGHHDRHSPGAVLSNLGDSTILSSPGGSDSIRHPAADPLATQLQISTSSRVTVARRHDSPPPPDSPRDGDESAVAAMTSRTDATVRTELLLRPTEEFVRSMSAKHGSGNHHRRSEPSRLDAASLLTSTSVSSADFESVAAAENEPGDSGDREGAPTWSDGRWAEPNRLDSRPPLRLTSAVASASSVAQSKRRPGGDSLAGTAAGGSLRALTGETVTMSLTSRSGRSSADSLASRDSSDGNALLGAVAAVAGRAAKERAVPRTAAAEPPAHARQASDSSASFSSARVAQLAAAAATDPSATAVSVGSPSQQRGSSARPNRTFELRRARTLAAPEVPSERSSARSSTTDSSSGIGKPRSRSGSLERASEVSLGARIVQRSRQSAAAGGGGGAGSSTAATFSAEVRGAKLPLTAKSTAPSGASTFARTDGGRYSMRVGSSGGSGGPFAAAAAAAPGKVDQRGRKQAAGVNSSGSRRKSSGADLGGSSSGGSGSSAKGRSAAAALLSSQAKAELEREKAAWERRRSYDPRRAAALGSTSGASSVSSTPRQTTSSLGSRASSGTSSPVTPIALRQQQQQQQQQQLPPPKQQPQHYAQPPPLLLDGMASGDGSAYASPLVTASSSRRGSAGTAGDDADYFEGCDDDGIASYASGNAVGSGDYDDDEGNEQVAEDTGTERNSGGGGSGGSSSWRRSSDPSEDPTCVHRLHGHGGRNAAAVATAVSAAKHELQIAKMSSELAKDLELLSRGAAGDEEPESITCGDGSGSLAVGRWPRRHDSTGGGSSGDEMASSVDDRRVVAGTAMLASRLVRDASSCGADDGTVPNTSRSCYTDDTASDATGRPDSCSGKSAFTSYSAFTEPGVTPPGKANSPALSPVKKKVVEAQSEENGGSPQIPDQNYDGVMVSSIKHISNRLSKSTSRILTRLREKLDLSSAHSSEEEAEAADRAAETLLGDHGVTELPGSQELAAALRTLRRAERNVRAVERALFTNDSYPEIAPTVTTHERDHYLAEIKRIRDEITGFKPITSAPTLSIEDAKKVTAVASLSASVATAKVLTTKPAGFTTVKSLTSLKKTYY